MEKSLIEQIEIYAGIFLKVALPLVTLTLGSCLISAYDQKDTRLKYIDIAVNVLNEKPSPEKERLRDWAIRTLNLYAEKKMAIGARKELKAAPLWATVPPATGEKKAAEGIKEQIEPIK